jgi:hypothetical protein
MPIAIRQDPLQLRSKEWHLDHKFSISEGYKNGVDPKIIGSVHNLEIIDAYTNSVIKNGKSSISLSELYAAFKEPHSV